MRVYKDELVHRYPFAYGKSRYVALHSLATLGIQLASFLNPLLTHLHLRLKTFFLPYPLQRNETK